MPKVLGAVKFIFGISPKALTGAAGICYIRLAMEVGLFFMPKIRIKWRWKLCAQKLHWHVQNVSNVIIT